MSYFVYSYGNPRALHVLPHPFLTRRSSVLDVRDVSLMAYGAAGGMLLPAALDLIPLREVVIPPHPGLFSALGLLSTDQVFHESESAYVVFSPDPAEQIAAVYDAMEARLSDRPGPEAEGLPVRSRFDGRVRYVARREREEGGRTR